MHGLGLFDPSIYSTLIKWDSLEIYSSKRYSSEIFLNMIWSINNLPYIKTYKNAPCKIHERETKHSINSICHERYSWALPMLYAMPEASDRTSCTKFISKNAANTKDSTNSPFGKFLAKTNYDHTDTYLNRYINYISFSQHKHTSIKICRGYTSGCYHTTPSWKTVEKNKLYLLRTSERHATAEHKITTSP